MDLKSICRMSLAIFGVLLTFYSIAKLLCFVSYPHQIISNYLRTKSKKVADQSASHSVRALLTDSVLILIFALTHSAMALPEFKNFLRRMNMYVLTGTLYAIVSSVVLLALTNYWKPVSYRLWAFDARTGYAWWIFTAVHAFAWIIIYGGSIQMDLGEIVGIKQVYYDSMEFAPPNSCKSPGLNEFRSHMRHPSFTMFALLLWTSPVMSLDRLLLAVMLTGYMLLAWKTTRQDCDYLRAQHEHKRFLLKRRLNF